MYGGVCLYVLFMILCLCVGLHRRAGRQAFYIVHIWVCNGMYVLYHILLSCLALFSMVWISRNIVVFSMCFDVFFQPDWEFCSTPILVPFMANDQSINSTKIYLGTLASRNRVQSSSDPWKSSCVPSGS